MPPPVPINPAKGNFVLNPLTLAEQNNPALIAALCEANRLGLAEINRAGIVHSEEVTFINLITSGQAKQNALNASAQREIVVINNYNVSTPIDFASIRASFQ